METRYEKQVNGYTKWLRSKNVEQRRKGAIMVGELGAADTIETLVKMAKNDPDAIVRQNAQYSLGMFSAFKNAIESEDDDIRNETIDIIEELIKTGKIGKRAKPSPQRLKLIMLILGGVFILLLAANIGILLFAPFGGFNIDQTARTNGATGAGNQSLDVLIGNARLHINVLKDNAQTLITQYEPTLTGGEPGETCLLFYNVELTPLEIADADRRTNPGLAPIYDGINTTLTEFETAHARMEQACFDGIPLTSEEATTQVNIISTFQNNVVSWENTLDTLQASTQPTAQPPAATEIIIPSATPDIRQAATNMILIIDNVTGARGVSTLLNQYWTEVLNSGTTDGCSQVATLKQAIPANVELLPGEAEASPELVQAAEQINLGLQVLRDGYTNFEQACNEGDASLVALASASVTTSSAAQGAFDNANDLITIIRGQ